MAVNTVQFTLNGQIYDLTYSGEGTYSAVISAPSTTSWNQTDHKYAGSVTATDYAGNSTTVTPSDFSSLALRVLEKVKPAITTIFPTAGALLSTATPTIQWTVTDAGSGIDTTSITLKIDSESITSSSITKTATVNGYTCTYTVSTPLTEGTHAVVFAVSDNDGNAAESVTVSFMVDLTPPVLVVTTPADNTTTNQTTFAVAGTSNDSSMTAVTVTVSVNGGTAQTLTMVDSAFSGTVTLTEGSNLLEFISTDAAGRTATVTRYVMLDTAAPSITNVTLTPNPVDAGTTYVITVSVSD